MLKKKLKKVDRVITESMLDKNFVHFGIQLSEAILAGVERMFAAYDKKMERRFKKLESGQTNIKREISDLKLDSPTRKEFTSLKTKVDFHHPNS